MLHWVLLHWWSWKILFIMHGVNDQFSSAVRKYDTDVRVILEDYSFSECKDFLYQIMPRNTYPICIQWYNVLWKFCQRYKTRLKKIYIFSKFFKWKDCEKKIIIWSKWSVIWWIKPLRWIREKNFLRGNNDAMISSNPWRNKAALNVRDYRSVLDNHWLLDSKI